MSVDTLDIQEPQSSSAQRRVRHLIDSDVHIVPRHGDEIRSYVAEPWRSRNWGPMERGAYLIPNGGARRSDSVPPDGSPAASVPEFLWKQLFDDPRVHVHYAILLENLGGVQHDPRFNAVYRAALNDWLAATWLGEDNPHGRYKGSISVSPDNPPAAAAEIERWAGHPHFVQVLLPPGGVNVAYGHPQFDPIWEAASRHGLPVALHVNSAGGIHSWMTPAGFPRFWSEHHTVMYPLTYAAHMVSLFCDGAFTRFENLRFVFVEGGFNWVGSVLDRLVETGRYLADELGNRAPLTRDFIAEHVSFTSQPSEDAPDAESLLSSLELSDARRMLMYASDYPHWDGDDPLRAFPRLPEDLAERIYLRNAAELYGLDVSAAADGRH